MANKTPSSAGGKLLATEIFSFMKDNIDAMKKDGANRDAAVNETQGTQDIANAIAFAIEKVLAGPFLPLAAPGDVTLTTVLAPSGVAPAMGTVNMNLVNPKYVFK